MNRLGMNRLVTNRIGTLMLALAVASCGPGRQSSSGMSEQQFITTMVELQQAGQQAEGDTTRFRELREEVLERHGVTLDDLHAFASAPQRDMTAMAAIWDSIAARLLETEDPQ